MSMPSQAVMAMSMYSEMFARSRGQGLLFVNLVRRVRCDPPQDTVQSDQQSMGSGAAISPPGFDAKTMHRLPAPLPQTGYDAPACKTNVQGDIVRHEPFGSGAFIKLQGTNRPYLRILSCRVVLAICNSSAVRAKLLSLRRRASAISERSNVSTVSARGRGEAAAGVPNGGKPCSIPRTLRSATLRSSRTLPGQS